MSVWEKWTWQLDMCWLHLLFLFNSISCTWIFSVKLQLALHISFTAVLHLLSICPYVPIILLYQHVRYLCTNEGKYCFPRHTVDSVHASKTSVATARTSSGIFFMQPRIVRSCSLMLVARAMNACRMPRTSCWNVEEPSMHNGKGSVTILYTAQLETKNFIAFTLLRPH